MGKISSASTIDSVKSFTDVSKGVSAVSRLVGSKELKESPVFGCKDLNGIVRVIKKIVFLRMFIFSL